MTDEMLDVLNGQLIVDVKRARDMNNRLMMAERAFLFPEGLPERPWTKHVSLSDYQVSGRKFAQPSLWFLGYIWTFEVERLQCYIFSWYFHIFKSEERYQCQAPIASPLPRYRRCRRHTSHRCFDLKEANDFNLTFIST